MDRLKRTLAPISDKAWAEIDAEARRTLEAELVARRLVDFDGPHGDAYAGTNLGRAERAEAPPVDGVEAAMRLVQPLVELTVELELSVRELDCIERGAADPELGALQEAARRIARCEDKAIFHGFSSACIRGMLEASRHDSLTISTDYTKYPELVARGLNRLEEASVQGPYALALGSRCWVGLQQATGPGGYPVFERVSRLVDGRILRAPAIDGAALLSVRGGDFVLTVGRDLSVGYAGHSGDAVRLFITESMTYRTLVPEAVVQLTY